MHKAGALAAEILDRVCAAVVPGVMTETLDNASTNDGNDAGGTSARIWFQRV